MNEDSLSMSVGRVESSDLKTWEFGKSKFATETHLNLLSTTFGRDHAGVPRDWNSLLGGRQNSA